MARNRLTELRHRITFQKDKCIVTKRQYYDQYLAVRKHFHELKLKHFPQHLNVTWTSLLFPYIHDKENLIHEHFEIMSRMLPYEHFRTPIPTCIETRLEDTNKVIKKTHCNLIIFATGLHSLSCPLLPQFFQN